MDDILIASSMPEGHQAAVHDVLDVTFHLQSCDVSYAFTHHCLACQRLVVMYEYNYSFLGLL